MGKPAIVIASAHHGEELADAFARYEREYDVRLVGDEPAAKASAKELLASPAACWSRTSAASGSTTPTSGTRSPPARSTRCC
jgi:hypothetical protein